MLRGFVFYCLIKEQSNICPSEAIFLNHAYFIVLYIILCMVSMEAEVPLIITLKMDANGFAFFDALRQQHFPRERNYLKAHITLFHQLPGSEQGSIRHTLQEVCQKQETLMITATEVKGIGRGVAYEMESAGLAALHLRLQRQWREWLTPQDKQKLWPHVTVQNKVPPEQAKQLLHELSAHFTPLP